MAVKGRKTPLNDPNQFIDRGNLMLSLAAWIQPEQIKMP